MRDAVSLKERWSPNQDGASHADDDLVLMAARAIRFFTAKTCVVEIAAAAESAA